MPVDEARYRAWEGRRGPSPRAPLTIAGTMARRLMRLRLVRWISLGLPFGVCAISSLFFYVAGQGTGHSPLAQALRRGLGRLDALAFTNRLFFPMLVWFGVLVASVTGATLISEDRRANALPLYFSRPIRRRDYLAGKLLTVGFFLALVLLLPPLCLYLTQLALATEAGVAWRQLPVLLRSWVPGAAGCVVLGAVALATSSVARNANQAALVFLGLILLSIFTGLLLASQVFEDPSWRLLSPLACLQRIQMDLLRLPPAFERGSRQLRRVPVGEAWAALSIWGGAALALLAVRLRRVEVVR